MFKQCFWLRILLKGLEWKHDGSSQHCTTAWEITAKVHTISDCNSEWWNKRWCYFWGEIMQWSLDNNRKIMGVSLTGDLRVPQQGGLATSLPPWRKRATLGQSLVLHPAEVTRGCVMFQWQGKAPRQQEERCIFLKSTSTLQDLLPQTPVKERSMCRSTTEQIHPNTSSIHPAKQYRQRSVKYI